MRVVPVLSASKVNTPVPAEPLPVFWTIALVLNVGSQAYPVVWFECSVMENCWPGATTICFPVGVGVVDAGGVPVAVWLLLVDDVQPAIDNEATINNMITTHSFFIIRVPLSRTMNLTRRRGVGYLKCVV